VQITYFWTNWQTQSSYWCVCHYIIISQCFPLYPNQTHHYISLYFIKCPLLSPRSPYYTLPCCWFHKYIQYVLPCNIKCKIAYSHMKCPKYLYPHDIPNTFHCCPHYNPKMFLPLYIYAHTYVCTSPSLSPSLPSGKRLHNYGKSQSLMGKLTINGHVQ